MTRNRDLVYAPDGETWYQTALNEAAKRREFADRIEALKAALNYVADMTYCGADAEWHFKSGYDPQAVLDALAPEQDK